jgi:hypothetical protein
MSYRRAIPCALLLSLLGAAPAQAQDQDDIPETIQWWADAELMFHPAQRMDDLTEQDLLVINVDPTRLFGAEEALVHQLVLPITPVDVKQFAGGTPAQRLESLPDGGTTNTGEVYGTVTLPDGGFVAPTVTLPPEMEHFYVASGVQQGFYVQKGRCDPRTDNEIALRQDALPCVRESDDLAKQFTLGKGAETVLRCPEVSKGAITRWLETAAPNPWSVVSKAEEQGKAICTATYEDVRLGNPIESVEVFFSLAGNPPEAVPVTLDRGVYRANIRLRAGTGSVLVRVRRKDEPPIDKTFERITIAPQVDRALVRVQAELLGTNQLRTVGFAVALTPVSKKFFSQGPWSSRQCLLLCTISPSVLLRLSGEQSTTFQLGLGGGVFLTRSLQLNGGVLIGTNNFSTPWRLGRSWYVGLALDPFLLAEAKTVKP